MPIVPEVVTADEADVSDAALTTVLNGQVMQSARTWQMIVDIPSAIEFFSSFTRLVPGDVIATGTPGGVGFARQPPVWLLPGDVIAITIEGGGTIRNRVVAEPAVFLLDEPTANLAPAIARSLLEEHVRRLAQGGSSVLIVEHLARAVLAISDWTYVLSGGEVRMEGALAELTASPEFVESFLGGTVAH